MHKHTHIPIHKHIPIHTIISRWHPLSSALTRAQFEGHLTYLILLSPLVFFLSLLHDPLKLFRFTGLQMTDEMLPKATEDTKKRTLNTMKNFSLIYIQAML